MAAQAQNLSARLRAMRRAVLGAAALAASAELAALAGALLALLSLLDLDPAPAAALAAARLLFWAGATVILARFLHTAWRVVPAARLARFIEPRAGLAPLELVSAVRLDRTGPDPQAGAHASPELAAAHVERMRDWLRRVPYRRLIPWRGLGWAGGATLAAAAALLAAALLLPQNLRRAVHLMLHPPHSAAVVDEPSLIGDIRLIYHFPAYSGRPDRLLEGTDGTIQALPGTEVEIEAACDREVRRAELRVGELRLPLEVRGRALRGRLTVLQEGAYRFALEDAAGRALVDGRARPIRIEPDQPPRIELQAPAEDRTLRADEAVELRFDARDDFGLSKIKLVWRVAGRRDAQGEKTLRDLLGERAVRHKARWELAAHGFAPGDRVQFYLEALDNDSVRGPKSGRSASRVIDIFSPEAQRRDFSRRAREAWEEMVSFLGTLLELDPGVRLPEVPPAEAQDAVLRGVQSLERRLAALLRSGRAGATPSALRQALARILSELRRQQQALTMQEIRLDDDPGSRRLVVARAWRRDSASFDELEPDRRALVRRLEPAVLYLEDLLEHEVIRELERLAEEMEATRERLARLLEEYRRAPSDEARRRIEAELASLRAQLQELRARQREMAAQLRDEYLNPQALQKALERADMVAALERLERMFHEGRIDQALAELEQLTRQSRDYRAEIARTLARFGDRRYRELARAVAQLGAELSELAAAQRRLLEATAPVRERQMRAMGRQPEENLRRALRRLLEPLAELRQRLERLSRDELGHFAQQDLAEARRQVELLRPLLEAAEAARALEVSRSLSQSTDRLAESLAADRAAARRFAPAEERRLAEPSRQAERARALARQIEDELRRLMPRPESALSAEDRQRLQRLERDQRDLARRLRRAQAEFERMNQQAPLFGRDMLGGARRAGQRMDEAAAELSRQNAQGAYPFEQSALAELEKLDQSMQKSCRRGAGGGQGMPLPMGAEGDEASGEDGEGTDEGGAGGRMSREEVEVPRPEDFEPPDRFRRELLDGMKDPVPPDFEALVRRYYQEIVQ